MTLKQTTKIWLAIFIAIFSFGALLLTVSSPVSSQSRTFVFSGRGWGHGVGLSQHGAWGRAVNGDNYKEILDFYYPNTDLTTSSLPNDLRILLYTGNSVTLTPSGSNQIAIDGGTIARAPAWSRIRISLQNGLWVINGSGNSACSSGCSGNTLNLHFATGTTVGVSATGRSYLHGRFTLTKASPNTFRVVLDRLKMEHYILGLAEMPSGWHLEAYKSQAVAARSYAYARLLNRRNNRYWGLPFDLYADTRDQAYVGTAVELSPEAEEWREAARATAGQILTHNGRPITAYYSASNGGSVARSEVSFAQRISFSTSNKADIFDTYMNPYASWERRYTSAQISEWLNMEEDTRIGALTSIRVAGNVVRSGRTNKATIILTGTSGVKVVSGARFFSVINVGIIETGFSLDLELPSTLFTTGVGSGTVFDGPIIGKPAEVLPTIPVGSLDRLEPTQGGETIQVVGWAFDGELENEDAELKVHLYLNGNFFKTLDPSQVRPDVFKERGYGENGGFSFEVGTVFDESIFVCAIAEDTGSKEKELIGCHYRGIDSSNRVFSKMENLEISSSGRARLKGWALNAKDIATRPKIQIFVNGSLEAIGEANLNPVELVDTISEGAGFDVSFDLPQGVSSVCIHAYIPDKSRTFVTLECKEVNLGAV